MQIPRIPVKRNGSDSPDIDNPMRYCIPNPYGMQNIHSNSSFDRFAPDAAVGYNSGR